MPFFLRHYATFADKIVVLDEHSTDGTREIVRACPIAELRDWPHRGLDDDKFLATVNTLYREARGKFDWVAFPDVDELLWHPAMLKMLSETKADMLQATGYAMISKDGVNGQPGQIYDHFKMGVPQPNYDKYLIWRPEVDIEHTLGRHTYDPFWPKCSGVKAKIPDLKLLHYHYLGVEQTGARNRRNYARCVKQDDTYGWNYDAQHSADPKQNGTIAWVKAQLEENKLVNVFTGRPAMNPNLKKLHFGCGGHKFDGWLNHDAEVDLRKPLPFPNASSSYIYASHVIEHISHAEVWNFFEECLRVLDTNSTLRIAIPDMSKMQKDMTDEYQLAVKNGGHGDGSKKAALKAAVFCHGHKAAWNAELLITFMQAVGFSNVRQCFYGNSDDPELCGRELHGSVVGESVARVETSVVEGTKI